MMDPRLVTMEEMIQELEWHYQVNGNTRKNENTRKIYRRGWAEDGGLEEIRRYQNRVAACGTMGPRLVKTEETVQELEWYNYQVNRNSQKVAGLLNVTMSRVPMSCS
jgi:hypothetical protein